MEEAITKSHIQAETEVSKYYSRKTIEELVILIEMHIPAQQKDWAIETIRAKSHSERADYLVKTEESVFAATRRGDSFRADELRRRMKFIYDIPIELKLGIIDRD